MGDDFFSQLFERSNRNSEYLTSRVEYAERSANRASSLADSLNRKVEDFNTVAVNMTKELRTFTDRVIKLVIVVETRHHHQQLEREIAEQFSLIAKARSIAKSIQSVANGAPTQRGISPEDARILESTAGSYWLSAATLSLAAWLEGNREKCDTNLRLALRADDVKASLFFCLTARRFGRSSSAGQWLKRYLQIQNPADMDTNAAVMFRAIAAGEFGLDGWEYLKQSMAAWMAEIQANPTLSSEVTDRFSAAMPLLAAHKEEVSLPLLRDSSPSWPDIEKSLTWNGTQTGIADFISRLTAGSPGKPEAFHTMELESLLKKLTDGFEEGEKVLRRDLLLCKLIMEEGGDMETAKARLEASWSKEPPRFAFSAYLADIVSGKINAGDAMTRLAVGFAKFPLEAAQEKLVKQNRGITPQKVDIKIGDWSGQTVGGENSSDLLASLSRHLDEQDHLEEAGEKPFWAQDMVLGPSVIILIFALVTITIVIIPVFLLAGLGFHLYRQFSKHESEKARQRTHMQERRKGMLDKLSAILGEVSSYRRLLAVGNKNLATAADMIRVLDPGREKPGFSSALPGIEALTPAQPGGPEWDISSLGIPASRQAAPQR